MTTVAYREGVLAADRAIMDDHVYYDDGVSKIARTPDGRLGGAVGSASFCFAFLEWVREGMSGTGPEAPDDCEALVVDLDGAVSILDKGGWFNVETGYYACGSGAPIALGAMFMGAIAADSVRAAAAHDQGTGSVVEWLALPSAPAD